MSLDKSVQSFFEKQTGQELSLDSLTKFMDESLLRGQMSFTEHQEYHPLVDELVFYVTQWHETAAAKTATNDQVQILLSFGLAFEVSDNKFWRIVKALGEKSLQEVKQDTIALMDTITYMKEAGILSNRTMRLVSELIHNLDALTAN